MKIKNAGFTLIELLVVIVILGILSTIGFANFKSYYGKAFDAERKAAIKAMATMVKVDSAGEIGTSKYLYSTTKLGELFDKNDYKLPKVQENKCYYYMYGAIAGNAGGNNAFAFATILEDGTILADGTKELANAFEAIAPGTGVTCATLLSAFPSTYTGTAPTGTVTTSVLCEGSTAFASSACATEYAKPTAFDCTTLLETDCNNNAACTWNSGTSACEDV